ncbi:hypothetical protein D3C73_1504980 [compost metagenome]
MRSNNSFLVMAVPGALRLAGGDELAERAHAGEMATGFFRVGREADTVLLLQRQAQFQRIDRVQAEAFHEQRRGRIDVLRGDVLQ